MTQYDPAWTMRQARTQYFADNEFGDDGGYNDAWVDFKLGPVPFPFPNTEGRLRAVRYHDLHHVLTGYKTDLLGEFEISAWELGAGCKHFVAAWQLNLSGAFAGTLFIPRRTFRAFVRGLHSESLYGLPLDELLDQTVREVRARMHVPDETPATTARDAGLFALVVAAGGLVGAAFTAVVVPLAPVGLVLSAVRKRELARSAARAPGEKPATA